MAKAQRICSIEGCNSPVSKKGWCNAHYLRAYRNGSPHAGGPERSRNGSMCSIPGCSRKPLAKNLCVVHYERVRRHGTPELDSVERGAALEFANRVSLASRRSASCIIWPFGKNSAGYGTLFVDGKKRLAHRYICQRVHGPAKDSTLHAAHNCGNRACVNPMHLRWDTPSGNCADKLLHGTHHRGERHGNAKLTAADVRTIRQLGTSMSSPVIAPMFGVSPRTIRGILEGRSWNWLD